MCAHFNLPIYRLHYNSIIFKIKIKPNNSIMRNIDDHINQATTGKEDESSASAPARVSTQKYYIMIDASKSILLEAHAFSFVRINSPARHSKYYLVSYSDL